MQIMYLVVYTVVFEGSGFVEILTISYAGELVRGHSN